MKRENLQIYGNLYEQYKLFNKWNKEMQEVASKVKINFISFLSEKYSITCNDGTFEVFGLTFRFRTDILLGERIGNLVIHYQETDMNEIIQLTEVDRYWFDHLRNTEFDENCNVFLFGSILYFIKEERLRLPN